MPQTLEAIAGNIEDRELIRLALSIREVGYSTGDLQFSDNGLVIPLTEKNVVFMKYAKNEFENEINHAISKTNLQLEYNIHENNLVIEPCSEDKISYYGGVRFLQAYMMALDSVLPTQIYINPHTPREPHESLIETMETLRRHPSGIIKNKLMHTVLMQKEGMQKYVEFLADTKLIVIDSEELIEASDKGFSQLLIMENFVNFNYSNRKRTRPQIYRDIAHLVHESNRSQGNPRISRRPRMSGTQMLNYIDDMIYSGHMIVTDLATSAHGPTYSLTKMGMYHFIENKNIGIINLPENPTSMKPTA